jgi:hypothetical protein
VVNGSGRIKTGGQTEIGGAAKLVDEYQAQPDQDPE